MMPVSQAAVALGAEHRGADVTFTSVGINSREVVPGQLFVALRGPHFDAHQFIPAARDAGAVAAIADREGAAQAPADLPLIVVTDTHRALTQLAHAWRSRFSLPVVGLTGSSGKTTVKEMIAAICNEMAPGTVHATRGNLNNEIGVPLTLLQLRDSHRVAVIEMGMNHAGEISGLTRLTRPDVALITNAGRAHIEHLGSEEAIARAKGEIFEGLARDGVAVINADDRHAALWEDLSQAHRRIRFGVAPPAAQPAAQPTEVTADYILGAEQTALTLRLPAGEVRTTLHAPGLHNVHNALAAAAAALALEAPPAVIAAGLAQYAGYKGRLQKKAGAGGAVLIDDTYNANPESVRAAIDVLAGFGGRRMLVLGDMGELGEHADRCHREAGSHARAAGIDTLYTVGDKAALAAQAYGPAGRHYTDIDALVSAVRPALAPDITLLVKGSRFMRMERVVEALAAEAPAKMAAGLAAKGEH